MNTNETIKIITAVPNTFIEGKLVVAWKLTTHKSGVPEGVPAEPIFAPPRTYITTAIDSDLMLAVQARRYEGQPHEKAIEPAPPPPTLGPPAPRTPWAVPSVVLDPSDWAVPPFTVIKATVSENAQRYLNITVAGGTARRKLYLRFYLGATTEPSKTAWNNCLAAFLIRLGVPKLSDTDQLLGKTVVLCIDHFRTALQSVESINEAMCMEDA